MSLAVRGNDFNFFFYYQKVENRARRSIMESKIHSFCQIDMCELAILGIEKVVFSAFSKIFMSCLRTF